MRGWLVLGAVAGLLLVGCYDGPAPESATADDRSSSGDPHAGMSSMEGAPGSAVGQPLGDSGGPVELDAITLTAPAGWPQMPPSSSFVSAEFALPRAEGDDADGRLTISTAGGAGGGDNGRRGGQ